MEYRYRIWIAHWPALHDPRPMAIRVRRSDGQTVEFRGPPYDHDGWPHYPAGQLHDSLIGPHASVLHAGDACDILPWHEDYHAVLALFGKEEAS